MQGFNNLGFNKFGVFASDVCSVGGRRRFGGFCRRRFLHRFVGATFLVVLGRHGVRALFTIEIRILLKMYFFFVHKNLRG